MQHWGKQWHQPLNSSKTYQEPWINLHIPGLLIVPKKMIYRYHTLYELYNTFLLKLIINIWFIYQLYWYWTQKAFVQNFGYLQVNNGYRCSRISIFTLYFGKPIYFPQWNLKTSCIERSKVIYISMQQINRQRIYTFK